MRHPRTLVAVISALLLLVAACGDDDRPPEDTETGEPAQEPAPVERLEPEPGLAASVGTVEIPTETVERLHGELSASPQIASQLEGEDPEVVEMLLRAQVLSSLVVQEIVLQAMSDDFDLEIGQEHLDAALDVVAREVGGEAELEQAFEAHGFTLEVFTELELPLTAALLHLEDHFGVDAEVPGPEGEPGEVTEEQLALQAWVAEQLAEADVRVASDYGRWNPQTGQVEPGG